MEELLKIILGFGLGGAFLLSPVMIVRMIIAHRERMARMNHRQEGAPGVVEEIAALRREMAQIRDTTTHYDLSFDAALTRVESRLHDLEAEKRAESVRSDAFPFHVTPQPRETDTAQTLNARR